MNQFKQFESDIIALNGQNKALQVIIDGKDEEIKEMKLNLLSMSS